MQVEEVRMAIPLNKKITFAQNDLFIPMKMTFGIPSENPGHVKKFMGNTYSVDFNQFRVENGTSILKDKAVLADNNVTVKKDGDSYVVLHQSDAKFFQAWMVPMLSKLVKFASSDLSLAAHNGKVSGMDHEPMVKWLKSKDLNEVARQAKEIKSACQGVLDLAVKSGSLPSKDREETSMNLSIIASVWGLNPIEKDPAAAGKK